MKDVFGRTLEIGDQVAHVYGGRYTSITQQYVVRFSEARVYLSENIDGRGTACHPHRCIKLEAV